MRETRKAVVFANTMVSGTSAQGFASAHEASQTQIAAVFAVAEVSAPDEQGVNGARNA